MPYDIQISDDDIDQYILDHNATRSEYDSLLEFDEVRRAALKSWDDLQACPGSGKTTLIAVKLILLARKWTPAHKGICVLTHTNTACDELRSRIELDRYGYKLLSYPHFIGTIQEFIDKYIALPITRSLGYDLRLLSGEEFETEFKKIWWGKFTDKRTAGSYQFSYYVLRNSIIPSKFTLDCIDGNIIVNPAYKESFERVIEFDKAGTVDDFLLDKKNQYLAKGVALYRDMYAYAAYVLSKNQKLIETLRHRFSVVLIDEMQDTQKFQDEIINTIFHDDSIKLQRFGDADQAIFDNMGGEEPNSTFNDSNNLSILSHSYRFTNDIASKVSNLSYSQIGDIQARVIPERPFQHTVIVYDDDSKSDVINVFSDIVQEQDENIRWKSIKAVGGTEGRGGLISAYWEGFDRRKSLKSPKPERLIDVIFRRWWEQDQGSENQYKLIFQSILDLLRLARVMDVRSTSHRYFNMNSMKSWLRENNHYSAFRELVTEWIVNDFPTNEQWNEQVANLRDILGITNNEQVEAYLTYEQTNVFGEEEYTTGNIFCASNGRKIEVGTIHSVKGETHDATLVLETKNHQHDIQQLLDHIAGIDTGAVTGVRKIKFVRQLYVAFSRARHLLCFSVHKDHVSPTQIDGLRENGWAIRAIYGSNN